MPEALAISAILKAAGFAAEKHRHQRRKDVEASPYINHPLEVARILSEEGGVTDEIVITAALLHDTVEDTETTFEEIERVFGASACELVREVTDDKAIKPRDRKRLQIEHAPHLSPGAKEVKIADKAANLRDLLEHPPADWSRERKAEYVEWARRVAEGCEGVNLRLDAAFRETCDEVQRHFEADHSVSGGR